LEAMFELYYVNGLWLFVFEGLHDY
jgi:hypothetical protein